MLCYQRTQEPTKERVMSGDNEGEYVCALDYVDKLN